MHYNTISTFGISLRLGVTALIAFIVVLLTQSADCVAATAKQENYALGWCSVCAATTSLDHDTNHLFAIWADNVSNTNCGDDLKAVCRVQSLVSLAACSSYAELDTDTLVAQYCLRSSTARDTLTNVSSAGSASIKPNTRHPLTVVPSATPTSFPSAGMSSRSSSMSPSYAGPLFQQSNHFSPQAAGQFMALLFLVYIFLPAVALITLICCFCKVCSLYRTGQARHSQYIRSTYAQNAARSPTVPTVNNSTATVIDATSQCQISSLRPFVLQTLFPGQRVSFLLKLSLNCERGLDLSSPSEIAILGYVNDLIQPFFSHF